MKQNDMNDLKTWCTRLEISDDDNGIGTIFAYFKIRDDADRMRKIFHEMSRNDAANMLRSFIDATWYPCEDWFEDWENIDRDFGIDFWFDNKSGEICMNGIFRAS